MTAEKNIRIKELIEKKRYEEENTQMVGIASGADLHGRTKAQTVL
jgi:hypothetical protein